VGQLYVLNVMSVFPIQCMYILRVRCQTVGAKVCIVQRERASDDKDARMVTSVITLFCLCVKVIHIYVFTKDLNEIIPWWGLS